MGAGPGKMRDLRPHSRAGVAVLRLAMEAAWPRLETRRVGVYFRVGIGG